MQDWWATLDWVQDKINLAGPTIRLMVAKPRSAPYSYFRPRTVEEGETVMTAFINLMRPFKQLADGGLAKFYAYFPYPWEWTEESSVRRSSGIYWLLEEMEALKRGAELYVMGSRYESLYANGREEPKRSDWAIVRY
jgi:hypothetical protein